MKKNKKIKVKINVYNSYYKPSPPENMIEYIQWCEDLLNSVPTEYRDTTRIETYSDTHYDGYGGQDAFYVTTINYWRDETTEEMNDRLIEETIRDRKIAEKDRKTFERFQKLYG